MRLLSTLFLAMLATAIIFAVITVTGAFIGIITMMMPFIIVFSIAALIIYSWLGRRD